MLDKQSQGPQCTACGSPMKLTAIEPAGAGQDRRLFTCPHCRRVQRHIIDKYRDRGLGGATTRRGYLRDSQRVHDSKACKGSLTAPTAVKI